MIAKERHTILLQKLRDQGYIEVSEVAEQLGISAATIRRDLQYMEHEGQCIRTRGGAVKVEGSTTFEPSYDLKSQRFAEQKRAIAFAALDLIRDGDTIILDAGSTTYQLAKLLYQKNRLTVVTNDLMIATKLASNAKINLICSGGIARANVYTLLGAQAEKLFRNLKVNLTFLGADAIHPDGTVANVNLEEVPVKQAMIEAGEKVILLTDSSKFSITAFAKVCHIKQIHMLITDQGLPSEVMKKIIDWGVLVKIA